MGRPKGLPKTGGRKAGTPNKVKLPDVGQVLSEKGINPAEKLVTLATSGRLAPHQEASVWQTLLEYSQPKPVFEASDADDEPNPADNESAEKLLGALREAHGNPNNGTKDS